MRITEIKATNMELTPAIREYIEKKLEALEKMTAHYSPCDMSIEVGKTSNHHQKGEIWRAEFHLLIPGGGIRIERTTEDLYASIDAAKDAMKLQLAERKDRS
jgi:putative sigma-54 modulation protein